MTRRTTYLGAALITLTTSLFTGCDPGMGLGSGFDEETLSPQSQALSAPGLERYSYDGAEVSTHETYTLNRGSTYKAEWIAKPVKGKAAITLLSLFDNSSPWTEICFETFGGNAGTSSNLFQTQFVTEQNGIRKYHEVSHGSPNIFDGNFHKFAITFTPASSTTPARIVYEVDGITLRTVSGGDANALDNTLKAYASVWKVDFDWGSWGTSGSYPLEPVVDAEVSRISVYQQNGSGWSLFRDYPFVDPNSLSPFMLSFWTFNAFDGYYRPEHAQVIDNRLNLRLALVDTVKPSTPQGLTATPTTGGGIALTWQPSTDNVRLGGYEIRRQGAVLGSTSATSYADSGLAPNTQFCYSVIAYDVRSNRSDESVQVCATTCAAPMPAPGLPVPWKTQDVGAVAAAGAVTSSNDTFTVKGSGADIWNAADEFRFVHQPMTGDGAIVARVASLTNTHEWAKAGVMIRESLGAGSKHAFMAITPSRGASFQWRSSTGSKMSSSTVTGKAAPQWVRVARVGTQLRGYVSSDGVRWTQIGSAKTVSMGSTVQVGLAVTSHRDGTLTTAAFDGMRITPGSTP
jgi:regulation of enolase protein 1 (concanavalin A-like superfamily)